jgi:hypothetical protein
MRRTLVTIPLLAVVALLVGCGPTPPPGDTPGPRPTPTGTGSPVALPTPTVTPTIPTEVLDPLDTVTSILLQTENIFFCDDITCGVDNVSYYGDPAVMIAKLTAVFGVTPESQRYDDGGGRFSEYHDWNGFTLYFSTDSTGLIGLGVDVKVAAVGGVAIETLHGVHVGTPMSEALELADFVYTYAGEVEDAREAHFDVVVDDASNWRAVIAFGPDTASGLVTTIAAPISTGDVSGVPGGF